MKQIEIIYKEKVKYEQFKNLEKEVILEKNNGINNNAVVSLIEAVNWINISEEEKNDINVLNSEHNIKENILDEN